jgi:aminoglycoside phosphotransferase
LDFIADLQERGVVGSEYTEYKQMSGGTTSVVAKLWATESAGGQDKPVYVIKANTPELNREEAHFLQVYQEIKLFPTLHDLAPDHSFLLYHFVPGEMVVKGALKAQALIDLVEQVINHYQPIHSSTGWGWCDEPVSQWQEFLSTRVRNAREAIGEHLTDADYALVHQLASLAHRTPDQHSAYLLHGDCGVHNFLTADGRLSGVIDATPVVGTTIYDLLYAYCSSPEDLSEETLLKAVSRLATWSEPVTGALCEEVLIALYCRIGTCVRHHPADLPRYLEAWQQWQTIYHKEESVK